MNKFLINGALLMIAGGFLYLFFSLSKTPEPTAESQIYNNRIAAFDYDGLHSNVTNQRLLSGDAVMFLKFSTDNKVYFFNSLADLQAYDPGHSGYIALDNPEFGQYYLGFYEQQSRTIEYQSLQNSGIAGITLEYNAQGQAQAASVIMADNSHRRISIVPINDSFLLMATLKPSTDMKLDHQGQK